MSKLSIIAGAIVVLSLLGASSLRPGNADGYTGSYRDKLDHFVASEKELVQMINGQNLNTSEGIAQVKEKIRLARLSLKGIDFWLRYLEPTVYLKINGPLPVEWETEVFEKFERPYRREGAGLSLAEMYLDEPGIEKDSLLHLIQSSLNATKIYFEDSITVNLNTYHHFFLANRLFLLNLAAIYTTGFECPNPANVIPELIAMLQNVKGIYTMYNSSFTNNAVNDRYLNLYDSTITFVRSQGATAETFNYFLFIRDYINPLFSLNQQMIRDYKVVSGSFVDYTLSNRNNSIFDKGLYTGQNSKGVYYGVNDAATLAEIKRIGKLLFYDPILSGNNQRSCVSCHKSTEYFTDTAVAASQRFDKQKALPRNTPTLINAVYNHLLMLDGRHISLQDQAKDVITNPDEMGGSEAEIVKKVMSCSEYKEAFNRFVKLTPGRSTVSIDHIVSAVTMYYSSFSNYYSPFDMAMNQKSQVINEAAVKGFNLFMSKAQCGTCHFVPQFNGVKPPYVSSEFEVVGVPEDTSFKNINPDSGRFKVNPAYETMHAFRTGTIRNTQFTKPYMHNGVFKTMEEVIDFYDAGGGVGRGLKIDNQTLSADSLKLTGSEKKELIAFIESLSEQIPFEGAPSLLPSSRIKELNNRKVGGTY